MKYTENKCGDTNNQNIVDNILSLWYNSIVK